MGRIDGVGEYVLLLLGFVLLGLLASCAYAQGRDRALCRAYCEDREPKADPKSARELWHGHLIGKTAERRACEDNCREGGDLESY